MARKKPKKHVRVYLDKNKHPGIFRIEGGQYDGLYGYRGYGYFTQEERDENKRITTEWNKKGEHTDYPFRTLTEAKNAKIQWEAAHAELDSYYVADDTFEALMEECFTQRENSGDTSAFTRKGNRRLIENKAGFLLKTPARKITVSDIDKVLDQECVLRLSAKRKNTLVYLLGSIFEFGISREKIKRNPVKQANRKFKKTAAEKTNTHEMTILEPDQLQAVMKSILNRPPKRGGALVKAHQEYVNRLDADIIYCLFWTGCRVHELLGMRFRDISEKGFDLQNQYKDGVEKHPLKNESSKRIVKLNKNVRTIIQQYRTMSEEVPGFSRDWYVFRTDPNKNIPRSDNAVSIARNYAIKELQATDEDFPYFTTHDLRHSYASYNLSHGLSPVKLSRQLGHSTVTQTLNTYSHITRNDSVKQEDILNSSDSEYV